MVPAPFCIGGSVNTRCRGCNGAALDEVFSFGRLPLANALVEEADLGKPDPVFPLDLAFCAECGLVQILETVPRERLFSDYAYFTSYSKTAVENARVLVDRVVAERSLGRESLAVEVASNDGYLLRHFAPHGVPVLGIE